MSDILDGLSPSSQRAIVAYIETLRLLEALSLPAQGDGTVSTTPDPRRIPGNLDAATALRHALKASKRARSEYRAAHRRALGILYAEQRRGDRVSRRVAGDIPPRAGCIANENGVQCGLPIHAHGVCVKHYRRITRRKTKNPEHGTKTSANLPA